MHSHVFVERHLIRPVAPAPEAMAVARLIDGDAVDPGPKARLATEAMNGPEDTQEDFLGDIERFVAIAQKVDSQLDHHPLVLTNELSAGAFVLGCTPLHQRGFACADVRPTRDASLLHECAPTALTVQQFRHWRDRKVPGRISSTMRRSLVVMIVLAAVAAGAVVVYQAVARDREYQQLLARGDAALADDQTFGAIEAYSGAVVLRPDSMLARLRRGETYQRRGDFDAAAHDFRAAASLDPGAPRPFESLGNVLYQMQRYRRAAEAYESAAALDDRSPRVSYKLALSRYRAGEVDSAITAATRAIYLNDGTAEVYYLLGLCLLDRTRTAEAQQAFEEAISIAPGFIAAREELADLYAAQNKRADELDQLQVIAGLDRDHIERQIAVGLAQARAGHGEPAIVALGTALERTPDQPIVYEALGRVWLEDAEARDDRSALNKALEALERVGSGPASTSSGLTLFGRALLRDGQFERAEQTLQQATTRFPVDPPAFLYYAAAAEHQNHFDAARHALIDYGSLTTGDSQLVSRAMRIAAFSMRLDDPETAAHWLQRAADVSPTDVRVLASLAEAQLKAGDREAARATAARGLDLQPDHPVLRALSRRVR